jgi:glycosyltransferase involved in cell wall biosynthesis
MRILYFSDNVSGHNHRFLRKLADSKHEVWFCDFATPSLPATWLPMGIRSYSLGSTLPRSSGPKAMVGLLPEVRKMIADIKPELIHAGPVQTCGYLVSLAEFHPMLLTSWGSDILLFGNRDTTWRDATQVAIRGADGLFVDSQWVLDSARNFEEISDDRVVMFPWGIEPGRFSPKGSGLSDSEYCREPGTSVLLCTRNWEPLYRIHILLEAFRSAYERNSRLRLVLIGGGSQERFIREFIRNNELESAITIPGLLDGKHLPQWFRAVDGYISCAQSDGTSISLLEAMATGLPVIVTDIPSNREWVTAGVNGWLAKDIEGFAEAILRVAKLKSAERLAISIENQKVVENRANWDRNFPKLLAMYEHLRANPRKPFPVRPSWM